MKYKGKDLFVSDARMLILMDYCIANQVQGVTKKADWCDKVGVGFNNISNIKDGSRGFTKEQLYAASLEFNVSMEYLFGFTDEMFRKNKARVTPLQLLKQAVIEVEAELNSRKKVK